MSSDRELDEIYRILLDVWKREIALPGLLEIESMERFIPRIKTLLQYLHDKMVNSSNQVFKQIISEYINRVKYLMEDIFETRFKKILHHTQNNIPINEDAMFPFENECYKSINLGFKGYSMAKNFVLSPEQKHIGQFIKVDENLLNNIQNGISAVNSIQQNLEQSIDGIDDLGLIDENEPMKDAGKSEGNDPAEDLNINQDETNISNEMSIEGQDFYDELNSMPELPESLESETIESETIESETIESEIIESETLLNIPPAENPSKSDSSNETQSKNLQSSLLSGSPQQPLISNSLKQESSILPSQQAKSSLSWEEKSLNLPSEHIDPSVSSQSHDLISQIDLQQNHIKKLDSVYSKISVELDSSIQYCVIRILADVPELVGEDLRIYGPFCPQDIVSLPKSNADIIISQRKAESVKPII